MCPRFFFAVILLHTSHFHSPVKNRQKNPHCVDVGVHFFCSVQGRISKNNQDRSEYFQCVGDPPPSASRWPSDVGYRPEYV